jgi:hypothetical protein
MIPLIIFLVIIFLVSIVFLILFLSGSLKKKKTLDGFTNLNKDFVYYTDCDPACPKVKLPGMTKQAIPPGWGCLTKGGKDCNGCNDDICKGIVVLLSWSVHQPRREGNFVLSKYETLINICPYNRFNLF